MEETSAESSGQREALQQLKEGDLSEAKSLYATLLEKFPDDPEIICGFYTSSYWSNRQDILDEAANSRASAAKIMDAWDRFETIGIEKKFNECRTFSTAMKRILGLASEVFREEFQGQASTSSVDTKLLMDLSRCLIRIEDYKNASDILQYASRLNKNNPEILFLLGEAYLSPEDPDFLAKGISCYRDAFFLDPEALDVAIIASLPVGEVLKELYEAFEENLELTLQWIPAYLLCDYFLPNLRRMDDVDLKQAVDEIRRLKSDLHRVEKKFIQKVRSRIAFYTLILLQHFKFHEPDSELYREYEGVLKESSTELYERLEASKNKR